MRTERGGKLNEKWILKPHWSAQGRGQRHFWSSTPRGNIANRLKEVKGSSQSFLEPAEAQEPFRGGFRSCSGRIDQIWAKVSRGKPILGCSLLLPTPILGVQLCNGHWEVAASLRSFDPRKKKVQENSSIESQKDFHRNCIFSLIVCKGKASLPEWDLAVQVY